MHNPFYNNNVTNDLIQVNYFNGLSSSSMINSQIKLSDMIKNKIDKHEYFYGIEISARSPNKRNNYLDYNIFKLQPLFTSIIWIGEIYAQLDQINDIPALKCLNSLRNCSNILSHLTCYNMTDEKIEKIFINNNDIVNVLALRGDKVNENQKYKHGIDLVKKIRNLKGNNVSIGVGGYPAGHPDSMSFEQDLNYLKSKVDAGADFIITQFCFSEIDIKKFIIKCRQIDITVPIIPGIYIPENFHSLMKMKEITKVDIPQELFKKFKILQENKTAFKEFAEENAYKMIKNLFDDIDLNVYGVQFFTLNHFDSVSKIVNKLF